MATIFDFNAGAKVLPNLTAATTTFNASEIAGDGTASYILNFTGVGNDYGSTVRTRIKASGSTIWDVAQAHLTAFVQRMSTSKFAYAGADTDYQLAMYTLDSKDVNGERYAAGFPNGQSPTVEVDTDGTGAAGTLTCGWRLYEGQFPFYSMLLGSQTNIPAATTNGRVPLTQPGLLRGFSINTVGLGRLRLVVNGKQLINLSGPQLIQSELMEGGDGAGQNPIFIKIDQMLPITAGNSFFELDTLAGWAGVANEVTVYTYVPQTTGA